MTDLRHGVITAWVALNVYRVGYDEETMAVDREETQRLRTAERDARRARGKSWQQFHAEWDALRPPEQALKYYGTWPGAQKNREVIRI